MNEAIGPQDGKTQFLRVQLWFKTLCLSVDQKAILKLKNFTNVL